MSDSLVQLFSRFGRTYQSGETIFLENEQGQEMYIILSGRVKITKHVEVRKKIGNTWVREGSEERVLAILNPGDFFGEMSLLNDKPRSAKAEAISQTKVIVLNKENFEKVLEAQPKLTIKMLKAMSNRVRELDKRVGWQFAPAEAKQEEEEKKDEVEKKPQPQNEQEREKAEKGPRAFQADLFFTPTDQLDTFLLQGVFPLVFLDCFSMEVFEKLKDGEKSLDEIAQNLSIKETDRLSVLLRLLTGLGLVTSFEKKFSNLPLTNRTFTKEGNTYMGNTLNLFQMIYQKGILSERTLLAEGKHACSSEEQQEQFLRDFFESFSIRYAEAVDFLFAQREKNVKKFIEVASSPASYAIEIQRHCPAAEGLLFDRKERAKEVESILEVFGLNFLMTVQTADPYEAVFPQDQSLFVISMQSALHGEKVFELAQKASDVLQTGGMLLIHDFLLVEEKTAPLRAVAVEWILSLFSETHPFFSVEEVREKVATPKLKYIAETKLSDQTTCLVFQKS